MRRLSFPRARIALAYNHQRSINHFSLEREKGEATMSSFDYNSVLAEMDAILKKPGEMSKADSARYDRLDKRAQDLSPENQKMRRARMAALDLELGIRTADNSGASAIENEFREYMRHGQTELLSIESRRQMTRAQGVGVPSSGGYVVPSSFADVLNRTMQKTDGLFEAAGLFESPTGNSFVYPMLDDRSQSASVVGENTTSTEQDFTVAAGVSWGVVPTWRSGMILASTEIVTDSKFDIATIVAESGGVRLARAIGKAHNSDLSSSAPVGVTCASTSAIAASELIDLVASVDPAYVAGGASFLMNLSTYASVLKLVGTSGNFMFPASTVSGDRPSLLGFPVYISPSFPSIAAGAKVASFGNHGRYLRRQVANSLTVKTFIERYATIGQVAYEVYLRADGQLLTAPDVGSPAVSQSPIKLLQMHS
jgi:HK97 family phage major capsid protein